MEKQNEGVDVKKCYDACHLIGAITSKLNKVESILVLAIVNEARRDTELLRVLEKITNVKVDKDKLDEFSKE